MQAAETAMAAELKDKPSSSVSTANHSRKVLIKALELVGEVALQGPVPPVGEPVP